MTKPSPDRILDPGRPFRNDWEVRETTRGVTLTGKWAALPMDLIWVRTDPLAVTLSFPYSHNGPVRWVMSLSLLTEGVTMASGDGDIDVRPLDQQWLVIGLRSRNGEVILALPRPTVEHFLDTVEEQIPVDVDTLIDVELRGILTKHEESDSA